MNRDNVQILSDPLPPHEGMPLSQLLPQVDPENAAATRRTMAALQGLTIDEPGGALKLNVRLDPPTLAGPWLQFQTPDGLIAVLPRRIAGRPAIWPTENKSPYLALALATCGTLEPVILAVESALNLALAPTGLGPPPQTVRAALQFRDAADSLVHELLFAAEAAATRRCIARQRPLSRAVRVTGALVLAGPTAPVRELVDLQVGDLVTTPLALRGGWPADLQIHPRSPLIAGRFRLGEAKFRVGSINPNPERSRCMSVINEALAHPLSNLDLDPHRSATTSGGEQPVRNLATASETIRNADLKVGLRLVLPEVTISLRQLDEVAEGCVLDLGLEGELRVHVYSHDQAIASGQLVALGTRYGVLVEKVFGS